MRFPHTVTVLRALLVADGKGNLIRDWAGAPVAISPAWVQPVSSDEQTLDQDRIVARWRVFLPADADVISTDRLVFAGSTYFIDGEVSTWDALNGAHHCEAYLRIVTG